MYDMANEHKKQKVFDEYLVNSDSEILQKSVSDGYILDLSGHTLVDIVLGAILGITLGIVAAHTVFLG